MSGSVPVLSNPCPPARRQSAKIVPRECIELCGEPHNCRTSAGWIVPHAITLLLPAHVTFMVAGFNRMNRKTWINYQTKNAEHAACGGALQPV